MKRAIVRTGLGIFAALGVLLLFSQQSPAGLIADSKHNLSTTGGYGFTSADETEICIFCHTPHGSVVTDWQGNRLPLWNRNAVIYNKSISAGANQVQPSNYTLYSSSTFKSSGTITMPTGESLMCLSCHDGITSLNNIVNYYSLGHQPVMSPFNKISDVYKPGFIDYPGDNIGEMLNITDTVANLSNDHPVSFPYDNALYIAAGGSLADPSVVTSSTKLKLFGAGTAHPNRLECATCHDVHDQGDPSLGTEPFLRISNFGSQMCLKCHNK